MLKINYAHFTNRELRTQYVVNKYSRFLKGKILDVGCDRCILKSFLDDIEYVGIDIQGTPDIYHDLEQSPYLPFKDEAFECVICTDVLEHIDNLHNVFGEMVRVSKKHLIISLPNSWCNARRRIERGKGSFGHYGLPIEKPVDRHKWFFSLSEAKTFVEGQGMKYELSITDLHATEKQRLSILSIARKLRYFSTECYYNRYVHTLWVLFTKNERSLYR